MPRRRSQGSARAQSHQNTEPQEGTSQQQALPAVESTPLLDQVNGVGREFADDLRNESGDPDFSVIKLIKKRPGTILIVFALFALLLLVSQNISQLWAGLDEQLARVPNISISYGDLESIEQDTLRIRTSVNFVLDYSAIKPSLRAVALAGIAGWVGTIDAQVLSPVRVRAQVDNQFKPFIHASLPKRQTLNISDGSRTELQNDIELYDVGRPEIVGAVVTSVLSGKTVNFRVEADILLSKYGLDYRLSVSHDQAFELPSGTGRSVDSRIAQVSVLPTDEGAIGIQSTGELIFDDLKFPVRALIPSLSWVFKLAACEPIDLVTVGSGATEEIKIDSQTGNLNVSVVGVVGQLAPELLQPCALTKTSPIGTFVNGYLSGQSNFVFVRLKADPHKSRIIHDLLGTLDVPIEISGKSESEHLIEQVSLETVRFDQPPTRPDPNIAFSGNVLIVVRVPSILRIDKEVEIRADQIRGTVGLFHNQVLFGTIHMRDWVPAATTHREQQKYEVTMFLEQAPFEVNDAREFSEVTRKLMLGGQADVHFDALVDVKIYSPAGGFELTDLELQGDTVLRT